MLILVMQIENPGQWRASMNTAHLVRSECPESDRQEVFAFHDKEAGGAAHREQSQPSLESLSSESSAGAGPESNRQ